MLGRDLDELNDIGRIVKRALALGVVPTLILAVLIGVFLSLRAQRRVEAVNQAVRRIVAGNLRERLIAKSTDDPFDKLALIVNDMLDDIEGLLHEIAGVGDDIAHELRTPLTRVRATLERGRDNAKTLEELQAVVDRGILGAGQVPGLITALLRIAEIEHGRRLSGFGEVELAGVCMKWSSFTIRSPRTAASISRSMPSMSAACAATAICCSRPSPTLWITRSSSPRQAAMSN